MAKTLLTGFEMLTAPGESDGFPATVTISTSIFRSGAASLRCNPSAANAHVDFALRAAGGSLASFAQSCTIYIFIAALPTGSKAGICNITTNPSGTYLWLETSGALTIADGGGTGAVTSSDVFTADSIWHRIDVDASGATRTVYVDGVQWAQATGLTTATAQTGITLCASGSFGPYSADFYLDDFIVYDSAIGAPNSGANNKIVLSIPTAGNNAGSWTDGAGGTGDIHGSVDNRPPVGVAAATAAAKIKNAATGSNLDYVATMQSYLAAGVPAGSIVNAVQAWCNDGEEATTGTKPGGLWIASNPAQTASTTTFDYGDDTATAVGTFPTGWATHRGVVTSNPSVTLATAPTVTVRKVGSTNRVVNVDFIGMYIDYTPPPIGKNLVIAQAVNRASFF